MISNPSKSQSLTVEAGPVELVESGGSKITVALMSDHVTLSERTYSKDGDLTGSRTFKAIDIATADLDKGI